MHCYRSSIVCIVREIVISMVEEGMVDNENMEQKMTQYILLRQWRTSFQCIFLILEIVSVINFIAGANNPKTFNLTTRKSWQVQPKTVRKVIGLWGECQNLAIMNCSMRTKAFFKTALELKEYQSDLKVAYSLKVSTLTYVWLSRHTDQKCTYKRRS